MNRLILKEFVREIMLEGGRFYNPYKRDYDEDYSGSKKSSILDKIKSLFTRTSEVDRLVQDWLDEAELRYDIPKGLPTDFTNDVKTYARSKWKIAVKKSRGDEQRALSLMTRALNTRYKQQLKDLSGQYEKENL